MKIVMFTDAYWPRVNGVTVSVDSFSRALVNEGHDVLIICSSYPEDVKTPISLQKDDQEIKVPKIIRVPSLPAFITKEDRIAKFDKLYWVFKKVDQFDPDIIHINTEMMIAEFGFWYARTHNLPDVYTFHTMWEDYAPNYLPMFPVFMVKYVIRKVLRSVLSRSYRVIVPTLQIGQAAQKYKSGLKSFLLPTGIDKKVFEHDEKTISAFREKMDIIFPQLKNKRILLFAGRIGKEKNIGFLLRILPKILEKHPDTVLLIAGNGSDLEYYQEEARRIGIESNCIFAGYFDRKDLALVYAISDVFVFPSLTDTQGLVTLEAMLSGTPVVAIGALGTLSVMGGDNGGFMVKDDREEFTGRVLELLEDPDLRQRKSQEARLHASSWSIEVLTERLLDFYEATIKDYIKEYGHRVTPVWERLMDKRWWKMNNEIIKKRTKQNLQKLHALLSIKREP